LFAVALAGTAVGCVDQTGAFDTSSTDGSDAESVDTADITTPVYPTSHPRIYLGPNKARLQIRMVASLP